MRERGPGSSGSRIAEQLAEPGQGGLVAEYEQPVRGPDLVVWARIGSRSADALDCEHTRPGARSHVEVGQTGALALTSSPGEPLTLTVRRIIPIAIAENGQTFFRVEADLDAPREGLRPGMEGIAKLDAGQRQRIHVWARPIVDAVRLWFWRWGV